MSDVKTGPGRMSRRQFEQSFIYPHLSFIFDQTGRDSGKRLS